MYLLAKVGGHRSYGNRDINSYINSYMDTFDKSYCEIFKIRNTDLQLRSPRFGWQKNEKKKMKKKKKKKNTDNCKACCFSRKRNKPFGSYNVSN